MLHVVIRRIAMLTKFYKFAVAATLLAAPATACKSDHGRDADKAADKVKKTVDEVKDQEKDVTKEQKDVTDKQADVAKAQTDFEKQKAIRINDLETSYSTIAAEPKSLTATSATTPLTDRAKADLNEKLKVLQLRLDEARNSIDQLKGSTATDWNDRDDRASDAMKRLEDARDDAKKALDKGERIRGS
jgi:chromosome segregation ATPase